MTDLPNIPIGPVGPGPGPATGFSDEQLETIHSIAREEAHRIARKEVRAIVPTILRPAILRLKDELKLALPRAVHPMINPITNAVERVAVEFTPTPREK